MDIDNCKAYNLGLGHNTNSNGNINSTRNDKLKKDHKKYFSEDFFKSKESRFVYFALKVRKFRNWYRKLYNLGISNKCFMLCD